MSSPLSVTQMSQLANKFTAMGWDASRVTQLGQASPEQFRQLSLVLDDRAAVQEITRLGDVTKVTFPGTPFRYLEKFFEPINNSDEIWIRTNLYDLLCCRQPQYAVQAPAFVCSYADLVLPASVAQIEAELTGFTKVPIDSHTAFSCYLAELIARHRDGTAEVFPRDGSTTIFTFPRPVWGVEVLAIKFDPATGKSDIRKTDRGRKYQFPKGVRVLMIEPA